MSERLACRVLGAKSAAGYETALRRGSRGDGPALTPFRRRKVLGSLRERAPGITELEALHVYLDGDDSALRARSCHGSRSGGVTIDTR